MLYRYRKYFLIVLFWCYAMVSFAQEGARKALAIAANETTTVSLFFPSPIAKVIPPSANFKFEHDAGGVIGLLQARKGKPSNLTVITTQGYIYSFSLSYEEKVAVYTHVLSEAYAIGKTQVVPDTSSPTATNGDGNGTTTIATTKPSSNDTTSENNTASTPVTTPTTTTVNTPVPTTGADTHVNTENPQGADNTPPADDVTPVFDEGSGEGDLYDEDREEYYRIFCENNYLQKTIFTRSFKQNKRIAIRLNNILVDRDEIYIVLQIENNSKKEYHVNGLSFFSKKNEKEPQKIKPPLYTFNLQEIIDPESVNEVVYVFKKFSLKNREQVVVVLDEVESNRMVFLPLDSKQINAPTN